MPSAVNPQSPESILLSGQGGFFARSTGSMPGDILESVRVRVRTACLVIAHDTEARENGEPEPTTLSA